MVLVPGLPDRTFQFDRVGHALSSSCTALCSKDVVRGDVSCHYIFPLLLIVRGNGGSSSGSGRIGSGYSSRGDKKSGWSSEYCS